MESNLRISLLNFYCEKCRLTFEGIPEKRDYIHPVYGSCTSTYSLCPQCGEEAGEYYKPKPKPGKSNQSSPPCGSGSCSCCM